MELGKVYKLNGTNYSIILNEITQHGGFPCPGPDPYKITVEGNLIDTPYTKTGFEKLQESYDLLNNKYCEIKKHTNALAREEEAKSARLRKLLDDRLDKIQSMEKYFENIEQLAEDRLHIVEALSKENTLYKEHNVNLKENNAKLHLITNRLKNDSGIEYWKRTAETRMELMVGLSKNIDKLSEKIVGQNIIIKSYKNECKQLYDVRERIRRVTEEEIDSD